MKDLVHGSLGRMSHLKAHCSLSLELLFLWIMHKMIIWVSSSIIEFEAWNDESILVLLGK